MGENDLRRSQRKIPTTSELIDRFISLYFPLYRLYFVSYVDR